MTVPYGIYIEDYSDLEAGAREIAHIDLIDEALLQKDRSKAIVHIYIEAGENPMEAVAFLTQRYQAEGIPFSIATEACREEDWINNWKRYFKPIPVGEKLLIRPLWEDAPDACGRTVLHLEPGLAFGTGSHETTRLCLELLEKYIRPGGAFLDVGCGSGILSVAALLLGAESGRTPPKTGWRIASPASAATWRMRSPGRTRWRRPISWRMRSSPYPKTPGGF